MEKEDGLHQRQLALEGAAQKAWEAMIYLLDQLQCGQGLCFVAGGREVGKDRGDKKETERERERES